MIHLQSLEYDEIEFELNMTKYVRDLILIEFYVSQYVILLHILQPWVYQSYPKIPILLPLFNFTKLDKIGRYIPPYYKFFPQSDFFYFHQV